MNGRSRADRALPLDVRLRAIADTVSASNIDELWVFPPLPNRDAACEFIVLTCYDGQDRRRILTAHVDAELSDPEGDELEWVQRVQEHGAAPCRWVTDIPDRLLQRLAEAGIPEVVEIGGRVEVWEETIARFANGFSHVDSHAKAGVISSHNGNGTDQR